MDEIDELIFGNRADIEEHNHEEDHTKIEDCFEQGIFRKGKREILDRHVHQFCRQNAHAL